MKFLVSDMTCNHCKATIENAIQNLDGNAKVLVDLESKTVAVETTRGQQHILNTLAGAGFEARVV